MSGRRVSVLGSTGSVGVSTLDLMGRSGAQIDLVALTAGRNVALLAEQALRWRPDVAVIADEACYHDLKARLDGLGIQVAAGADAVIEAAGRTADWSMAAIVGVAGLRPVMAAARTGTVVALANKESIVCGGALIPETVKAAGGRLLPVEFRALRHLPGAGRARRNSRGQANPHLVRRPVPGLVAPGNVGRDAGAGHQPSQLRHGRQDQRRQRPDDEQGAGDHRGRLPVWHAARTDRGPDPSPADHPLHGGVSGRLYHGPAFAPGYARPYRVRMGVAGPVTLAGARLDLAAIGALTFEAPDEARFPALGLAREAMRLGGGAPAALNAANEVAVEAFLNRRLGFLDIVATVAQVLETMSAAGELGGEASLEGVLETDRRARSAAEAIILPSARRN